MGLAPGELQRLVQSYVDESSTSAAGRVVLSDAFEGAVHAEGAQFLWRRINDVPRRIVATGSCCARARSRLLALTLG